MIFLQVSVSLQTNLLVVTSILQGNKLKLREITGEGNGTPLQCSCLENPRDWEPGGLLSMGSHRVGHDGSDLPAAAAALLYGYTTVSLFIQLLIRLFSSSFLLLQINIANTLKLTLAYKYLCIHMLSFL